jgi:DNA modification methylase
MKPIIRKPAGSAAPPAIGHNQPRLVEMIEVAGLKQNPRDPRRFKPRDVDRAEPIVARFHQDLPPIVLGRDNEVIAGYLTVLAARRLKLSTVAAVKVTRLSEAEELALSAASNKLWETGEWDSDAMLELVSHLEIELPDVTVDQLGWTIGELDTLVGGEAIDLAADRLPRLEGNPISMLGDVWACGKHRVANADATIPKAYRLLCGTSRAAMIFTDHPYGCKINGFVSKKGRHAEFVEASGEKTEAELSDFFVLSCNAFAEVVQPGALIYLFIDWRSQALLNTAAEAAFGKLLNLCVWVKDRAGMGSLYRSRHELVLLFRAPGAKHRNNVELGRHGRNRSNVWEYPAAMSTRSGPEGDLLASHPTPKPVALVMDAIMDSTRRGDIVLDPFLGSGTAVIAADRAGRRCFGMDLNPLFVDLTVRRWQEWTGLKAIHEGTGRTFDEVARLRLSGETRDGE